MRSISHVARLLADAGHPVWDADDIVRELSTPGGPVAARIEAEFPGLERAGLQIGRAHV